MCTILLSSQKKLFRKCLISVSHKGYWGFKVIYPNYCMMEPDITSIFINKHSFSSSPSWLPLTSVSTFLYLICFWILALIDFFLFSHYLSNLFHNFSHPLFSCPVLLIFPVVSPSSWTSWWKFQFKYFLLKNI